MPFASFESDSRHDGERLRLGAEAAWLRGPYALFAEALSIAEDVTGSGGSGEATTRGWYLGGSWVLTGEPKTLRGVHPKRPLVRRSGATCGSGAWQLAARYSELDLDQALVEHGLLSPESFPGRVSTLDIGLNWYATYHVRVKLHALHTEFDEPILIRGENRRAEDAVLLQFQVHF